MEALLKAGADPRARNAQGQTAIDIAHARKEDDKSDLILRYLK
jgi:ankyrin repeat protein